MIRVILKFSKLREHFKHNILGAYFVFALQQILNVTVGMQNCK
jgi:cytochrome b